MFLYRIYKFIIIEKILEFIRNIIICLINRGGKKLIYKLFKNCKLKGRISFKLEIDNKIYIIFSIGKWFKEINLWYIYKIKYF